MPNWTHNEILCKKELADKLLTKQEDKYLLDFNKLIPMPKTLEVAAGSVENEAVARYYLSLNNEEQSKVRQLLVDSEIFYRGCYWYKYLSTIENYRNNPNQMKLDNESFIKNLDPEDKKISSLIDLGKQYVSNIENYQFSNWYDWSIENWGTKWNVEDDCIVEYNEKLGNYQISFNTAWSMPIGIFEKFQEFCKDGELYWLYENEDYDGTHVLTKVQGEIIEDVQYYEVQVDDESIELD